MLLGAMLSLLMHVKAFLVIWDDDGCTCHFLTQVLSICKASIYFFAWRAKQRRDHAEVQKWTHQNNGKNKAIVVY